MKIDASMISAVLQHLLNRRRINGYLLSVIHVDQKDCSWFICTVGEDTIHMKFVEKSSIQSYHTSKGFSIAKSNDFG